jgi:hypothetical protein
MVGAPAFVATMGAAAFFPPAAPAVAIVGGIVDVAAAGANYLYTQDYVQNYYKRQEQAISTMKL